MMFSDESLLDEGGMEIFCQELSAYLQQCFSERVSVKTVKENLNRSVNMLIYSVLKAYIRDKETIQEWSSNVSFYEDLQKIATMNELKEKTIHCVERFREKLLDQLNDDYFQDIFRFIDEKLSEDLSLEDMADFNQQSVSAFSKKFKEKTKMTPVQYLNVRRVEKVKECLKKREYTLGEIAELTGFSSENYMVRVFKKVTGKTITSYRRELEGTK